MLQRLFCTASLLEASPVWLVYLKRFTPASVEHPVPRDVVWLHITHWSRVISVILRPLNGDLCVCTVRKLFIIKAWPAKPLWITWVCLCGHLCLWRHASLRAGLHEPHEPQQLNHIKVPQQRCRRANGKRGLEFSGCSVKHGESPLNLRSREHRKATHVC